MRQSCGSRGIDVTIPRWGYILEWSRDGLERHDTLLAQLRLVRFVALTTFALLVAACGGEGGDNNRPGPENNARLTALVIEQVTLIPAFASRTYVYTATVANSVTSTRVTPTAANAAATIRVNGTIVASGATSAPIALAEGANTIAIAVTSEDGSANQAYTVTITRRPPPGTDASLASLALTVATLDQIFDPANTDYTASAGFLGVSTRVIATPEDPDASVRLNGSILAPGEPGRLVSLAAGASTLTIAVTAADGTTTRSYEIEVTRGPLAGVGQEAYVKASNTGFGDLFGNGVPLTEIAGLPPIGGGAAFSGDTLAAGAPREDSQAVGIDGIQFDDSSSNAGAAYLFQRRGADWDQAAYVKASNTDAGDLFGRSLALDGDLFAVGATGEDSAANRINGNQLDNSAGAAGAVYAFARDAARAWRQSAYLKASNSEAGDQFGGAVSVHGNRVLVGARLEDSGALGVGGNQLDNSLNGAGAAYLFERGSTGSWQQLAYIKATNPGSLDEFGTSVTISGDTIAVGAWGEDGGARGIDGNQLDNSALDAGAVYLYQTNAAGNWTPAAYVKASNPRAFDQFGTAVALDGDLLAVGAPGQNSRASGIDGNELDQSLLDAGAVYVFERDAGGRWRQIAFVKASRPSAGDTFGASVALSGNLLAVGAPGQNSSATGINGFEPDESSLNAGAVYLFERNAAGLWSQIAFVKASNTDPGDQFGGAVSADGDTVIAGAQFERSSSTGVNGIELDNSLTEAGAVYVIR